MQVVAETVRAGWNGRPARWPTRPASGICRHSGSLGAMRRLGSLREMLPASRRKQRADRPFHPMRVLPQVKMTPGSEKRGDTLPHNS